MKRAPCLPVVCLFGAIIIAAGCGPTESVPPDLADAPGFKKRVFHLEAPCEINVSGVGMVDIEEEYLPGVVACENGNAPPEALKAQAVQARTFLYYKIFVNGQTTIGNSQSDQVYSCSYRPNGPGPEHVAAVDATRGQYLTWEDTIIASFYVAAAIPPNPDPDDPYNSCRGNGGNDPTNTERFVTYNLGKSGCDIQMSNQGFVPADCRDNPHNRGTASQNGQSCLANTGVGYRDMFAMYYGDDIELVVADGACGGQPLLSPEEQFCADAADGSHCFDAATLLACAGGELQMRETCDEGCGEGACLVPVPPTFCTGKPDGEHCDGASRVECAEEMVSLTEACPAGCEEGKCIDDDGGSANNLPGNNSGGPNNSSPDPDNGANPGGEEEERPTGEVIDRDGLPPVLGTSPGVSGGCSTTAPSGGEAWLLLGIAGLILRKRRHRRAQLSSR